MRRIRFSIRSLLVLMTMVSIVLGVALWRRNWYIRQAESLARLQELGLARSYGFLDLSRGRPWRAWHLAKDTARQGHIIQITSGDDRLFEYLPHVSVRRAYVSAGDFDDEDLQKLVHGAPGLTGVVLRKSRITNEGLKCLVELSSLSHLSLGDLCIYSKEGWPGGEVWYEFAADQFSDDAFAIVGEIPTLRDLRVISASLGTQNLASLSKLGHLERLVLIGRRFNDGSLSHVASLRRLRQLLIGNGQFSAAGVAELAKVPLRHLAFKDSKLTGDALGEIRYMASLEKLSLEHTGVLNEDLKRLAGAPKLWNLYLAGGELDNGLLKYISGLPALKHLHLHETGVDDDGVDDLLQLKLHEIYVTRTQFSAPALQKLANYPRLAVFDAANRGDAPILFFSFDNLNMHPDVPPW